MILAASTRDLTKEYVLDGETVRALRGVSLDVPEGDWVAIMGASGSGKSTMLNLFACLDRPTSGTIKLGEDDVSKLNDDQLSEIRASRIGIVFQSYNLIPQLTVIENIEVPPLLPGGLQREGSQSLHRTRRDGRTSRPPQAPAHAAFWRTAATGCYRAKPCQRPLLHPCR